ncbi:hypothetical protein [Shewanella sp. 10N.286.52.B9]|uniref:hypothetical protein n=1 Tax=Shewanella sp. 10N.286.52.B9 TaxID=1880837 RepID=UPI000C8320C1|nr:hypothetical protein [Shewanella sp. 10N.286.52.B9]PMG39959.1 hypothetical protein BCU91_14080 [Shewanella sp. 10N.286.52.B9]
MFVYIKYQVKIIKNLSYFIAILLPVSSFANNLPLMKDDIHRIEYPEGMQVLSTVIQSQDSLNVIYSHFYNYDWKAGELRNSKLELTPTSILSSKPMTLGFENNKPVNFRTGVSSINKTSTEWLYFVESETTYHKSASAFRAQWKSGELVHKQLLSLPTAIAAASSPKWYLLNNGKVALVYRTEPYPGCCQLLFSLSDDGVNFDSPVNIGSGGAMPALAMFSSNELIYTFQTRFVSKKKDSDGKEKSGMRTHFRLSSNQGANWREPIPITTRVEEVHDASPIRRRDGYVDVYYSSVDSHENDVFSLWRRCVSTSGKLGPEELVVDKSFGNVAKVSPHRLGDGSLLLTFVEQGKVYSEGEHNLHSAKVLSDAKCGV